MMAGGGLPRGHVVGQSTSNAGDPLTDPVTIQQLTGTLMHTLFNTSELHWWPIFPAS